MIRQAVRQNVARRMRKTIPTRREDSTAALGVRRTDWRWGCVFRGEGATSEAWSGIPGLGRRFESPGPRKQRESFRPSPFYNLYRRECAFACCQLALPWGLAFVKLESRRCWVDVPA